ncbi:MAG: hypothetical protein AB7E85_05660 [Pseudobdellovibrionaceae bacterium]
MTGWWKQTLLPSLGLFASLSTLLCCALPALLVSLGMGAALAGFVSAVPWITALSVHKKLLFLGAALMLILASILQYRARHAPCPADPLQAKACMRFRKLGKVTLIFAWIVYGIGFFFAFIAAGLFYG